MRKLAVLVLVACAGAPLAIGSSRVASALTLAIHANDHAHSVMLQPDGDHLDVVLSHGARETHEHGEAPRAHEHPVGVSESDHVVHVTTGDAVSATPRRSVVHPSHALAIADALPVAAVAAWSPARSLEPRARNVDYLRTVVLRI